jgi:hypothetical protein
MPRDLALKDERRRRAPISQSIHVAPHQICSIPDIACYNPAEASLALPFRASTAQPTPYDPLRG